MNSPVKQLFALLIVTFLVAFLFVNPAFAHPGRTASDGCHYCRTNCDKWGVPWNTRHCHGGVSIEPEYSTPKIVSTPAPQYIAPTATPKPRPTVIPTPKPTLTPTPTPTSEPKATPTLIPSPEPTSEPVLTPEVKGTTTQETQLASTAGAIGGLGTLGVLSWGAYKLFKKLFVNRET